jgi:hypothetical protein
VGKLQGGLHRGANYFGHRLTPEEIGILRKYRDALITRLILLPPKVIMELYSKEAELDSDTQDQEPDLKIID